MLMNLAPDDSEAYPDYSLLHHKTDWVEAAVLANPALEEDSGGSLTKWVLSIGGRVADLSKIALAVGSLARMLKCGFEFEHYAPTRRAHLLSSALEGLTEEEAWILNAVCRSPT